MNRRIFFLSFFLFSFLLTLAPLSVDAALIPCGRNSGTASEMAPCTICHIIVGGAGLITWGLGIMTVVAICVIVAMAILYIVSAGYDGLMTTAKGGIKASLIGFAVILGAWLIVNVVLTMLSVDRGAGKPLAGLIQTNAFTFTCDTTSTTVR
ncbi:MAG: hypothetical protein COZ86_02255 [Candidatus Moranbacteria bacterium CG_4_8_14_3_um_filter_41_13]|nr:MAG: hypothetical protein AUK58_00020 [Candidatus Moranbacteria bacterium CG2_30_41_165]PIW94206.1 MAG: hypothetical protein COZ86_02255 [Candidatus Moranbacteria bacterium CG_4_8_14_3_um_filter_41_13]